MSETTDTDRVAVYFDFDNVVISRYDQLFGQGAWRRDHARDAVGSVAVRLAAAQIDVGEILDYASSFGTVAVTRAYADWSVPANAAYRGQLVDRAVDLTQLFPASGTKNGADIRLAVDVLEDLFRLPDISHVVIVAGDSDYVALVQRCKRLGRVVVAIGVTGSTSKVLVSACDAFEYYDDIVDESADLAHVDADGQGDDPADDAGRLPLADIATPPHDPSAHLPGSAVAVVRGVDSDATAPAGRIAAEAALATEPTGQPIGRPGAGRLLIKALGLAPKDDDGWSIASAVKSQMKRLNPQFAEKSLGFDSFTDFIASRLGQVELREEGQQRFLRLRAGAAK